MPDFKGKVDLQIGTFNIKASNIGEEESLELDEKDTEIAFLKDRIKQLEIEIARLRHQKQKK